jgi:nicotinamide-nucleotide amidase
VSREPAGDAPSAAEAVVRALTAAGSTLAVAESLTGGLVSGELTGVPGASAVLRGGVVAYATDLKAQLLGVDPDRLRTHGPVDGEVARQMARGAARALGAEHGVATTGVAGPQAQGGRPVGEVWVAAAGPRGELVRRLQVPGGRAAVRTAAVVGALDLLLALVEGDEAAAGSPPVEHQD